MYSIVPGLVVVRRMSCQEPDGGLLKIHDVWMAEWGFVRLAVTCQTSGIRVGTFTSITAFADFHPAEYLSRHPARLPASHLAR